MRYLPHLVLVFSAAALGTAYAAEFGFGLEPCPLCLYQRVPYWIAAALGLAALATPAGRLRTTMIAAAGLVFLAGAGIAFYHVGVERHWWASAVCGTEIETGLSVEQLAERLMATPPQSCDQINWSLFGISMATYNAAFSLVLAVGTFAGAYFIWKSEERADLP
jgi:disulfide bond formation protein DsbB